MNIQNLLLGVALSLIITTVAYLKKSLSLNGLIAAVIFGTTLFVTGSWQFYILLLGFFISSSILSKLLKNRHIEIGKITAKGSRRDASQVIANGGVPMIFAIFFYYTQNPMLYFAFATSLAAANSDTWASEIGPLSRKMPRLLLHRTPIAKGISGGVTALGFLASLAGSIFIAMLTVLGLILMPGQAINVIVIFVIVSIGGFAGSVFDSILGELFQAKYITEDGLKITEKRYEGAVENKLIHGRHFFNNNLVNFISIALASLLSVIVLYYFTLSL